MRLAAFVVTILGAMLWAILALAGSAWAQQPAPKPVPRAAPQQPAKPPPKSPRAFGFIKTLFVSTFPQRCRFIPSEHRM